MAGSLEPLYETAKSIGEESPVKAKAVWGFVLGFFVLMGFVFFCFFLGFGFCFGFNGSFVMICFNVLPNLNAFLSFEVLFSSCFSEQRFGGP